MTASAGTTAPDRTARMRAGLLSLGLGIVIFAVKLLAWWLTGSAAVFSDALESTVNVAAAGLLVWSLRLAAQPADRNHPYGHGKVEFFAAGVEGTLIAIAAALIFVEAVREILRGPDLRAIESGLVLVSAAALANAGLGAWLVRVGRRTHSLALVADGKHLITDVVTSAGVVVGLLLVRLTGWVMLDPLVAIAVALNILRTGSGLVREAVAGLMDEADLELLARIVEGLEKRRAPWWIDVHGLRAWRSGPVWHADLHLVVPRYFDAERLHRVHEEVEEALRDATGLPGEGIVHFDPCRPRHCRGCTMEACPVRAAPFEERTPFTLRRATREDEPLDRPADLGAAS